MSAAVTTPLPRPPAVRSYAKPLLWTLIALAGISVLIFTEYPILAHPNAYTKKLIFDRNLLVPHAIAGVLATILGPFLFSTRFRSAHYKRHRIMGRVYIISVAIAAPTAAILGQRGFAHGMPFAGYIQSSFWLLCTVAAFLTARNRQLVAHRQWMIRSYLFTLNFIISRVPNPIPAYVHMPEGAFALTLMFFTICYFFFPDIYFNWRELTTRRA
jgi:uncharacterized membrane protein